MIGAKNQKSFLSATILEETFLFLWLTFANFLNIAVLFRCLKKLKREHLLKSGTGPPL